MEGVMGFLKNLVVIILFCLTNVAYSSQSRDHNVQGDTDKVSSHTSLKKPYSILLIEEGENSLGIYHSETRVEIGRVKLNFYPHEIEVSEDMKRAYVSNFGIRDYDAKIGYPGNSISIIDLENFCEIDRLYTTYQGKNYWGPHGLKLHPDVKRLYVNVECVNGRYPTSNAPQESMMLIFDLDSGKPIIGWRPPSSNPDSQTKGYPLLAGTHNFIFSPHQTERLKPTYRDLWYYAGQNGVTRINSDTGAVIRHYPTNIEQPHGEGKTFNGAVRGLAFNSQGTRLLVSAKNEISIIDVTVGSSSYGDIIQQIRDLGVGQLFYSRFVPGTNLILAPAARESQVLVIDTQPSLRDEERVIRRIVTGVDPLQVMISPFEDERRAFITNANSSWVSEIDLKTMQLNSRNIRTKGGANGIAFSNIHPCSLPLSLKLGVCLPFTGQYAAEGRECFLGVQFWQEVINKAGGIVVNGERYEIEICYEDTRSTENDEELRGRVTEFLKKYPSRGKNEGILAMFGTYPPSANLIVAQILKLRQLPLITSTGREPYLFSEGLTNIFGISPLRKSPDLIGTFQAIYKDTNPKPRTAMILSCDLVESIEEAKALAFYLTSNGIKVLSPLSVDGSDVSPIIPYKHCRAYQQSDELRELNALLAKIAIAARENCQYYPDLLFISGHRKESATIINTCAQQDFTYGALALNAGITSHFFLNQVTAPVENLLGTVCWSENCSEFAKDRLVASSDFQRVFYDRYSEDPSDLIAGFAATGIIIEEAFKKCSDRSGGGHFAGTTLFDALRATDIITFYGPVKFESNGANVTKPMITVQLRTQGSKLQGVPVWPLSVAGNERPIYPL